MVVICHGYACRDKMELSDLVEALLSMITHDQMIATTGYDIN